MLFIIMIMIIANYNYNRETTNHETMMISNTETDVKYDGPPQHLAM